MDRQFELDGRTTLITGASAGIGQALARQYAAAGANLIVVARRLDRLQQIADELSAQYGVSVTPLAVDLSDPNAPPKLCAELSHRGLQVDILVNNAGYGIPGKYLSVAWPAHRDFEQVMTVAVMHLTWLLLPAMVERGWGRVINIASLAGHLPGSAGHTCYEAVKAWMIRFSESLHFEYGPSGVVTTAICPGFTYSEFHDVTGTREQVSKMGKHMWMSAEQVAREAIAASEAGKVVHITGFVNRVIARLFAWLPWRAKYGLIRQQSGKFRKTD